MAFSQELENIYQKNWKALMENVGKIKEDLKKKSVLSHAIEIATEEKQNAYALGYQFYQQQKYDRAMIIFTALHAVDPLNKEFSKAHAATLQMLGNFPDAAISFLMAYLFNPEDLELAMCAGRCMVEAKEYGQSYFILKNVLTSQKFPMTDENRKAMESIKELMAMSKKKAEEIGASIDKVRAKTKSGAPVGTTTAAPSEK
ncbi:MAG: tetratricopeptide repeat protein [Puniceicoccales bacterium]|jgi:tetratricopeptide (TPR) repeat protein|nr:tetratricopeptide repeat protein [Puniceicoccales bacterium]